MLELEQARDRIFDLLVPLPAESLSLLQSPGRVLWEDITAPLDLPLFDSSAMDGFAVRAEDLAKASRDQPTALDLVGEIPAGKIPGRPIEPGTCMRIFTGSALPSGADAVIMQEDTSADASNRAKILCFDPVKPWENVRLRGEDLKKGHMLVRKGERISAG